MKYYVYSVNKKEDTETYIGKYDSLEKAEHACRKAAYYEGKERNAKNRRIEVRVYTHDIDDEYCWDFDYNTVFEIDLGANK